MTAGFSVSYLSVSLSTMGPFRALRKISTENIYFMCIMGKCVS